MARRRGESTKRSFDRAARRIASAGRKLNKIGGSGVRLIGEEIMTDIKASRPGRGVPRDTGKLASTGRVEGPDRRKTVTLSFGGDAAPYALIQHEAVHFHHKLGEARYLVRGMERWRPSGSPAMQALAENMQAGLDAVAERRGN